MPDASGNTTAASYGDITRLIERLHRRYLDVIRYELSQLGIDDINAVQALLLMNVQASEVSIRELVDRGYYIGSNVTYNVRHLVETGYLDQERSEEAFFRNPGDVALGDVVRAIDASAIDLEALGEADEVELE